MPEEPNFAPKCIWCSAPWSDANVDILDTNVCSEGCESTGAFTTVESVVTISCHACNREMFRKDGFERTY